MCNYKKLVGLIMLLLGVGMLLGIILPWNNFIMGTLLAVLGSVLLFG